MDFKQIQELIKMINKSNIGEMTIEQKDFRLTIKQKEEHITQVVSSPVQAPVYTTASQPVATQSPTPATSTATGDKPKSSETVSPDLVTIKSPMIGTFYRRS